MSVTPSPALGERYELGEVLGRGGMADVYRATDRILGRQVAVKVLRETAADDGSRERFSEEARMLASLDHPGLVTVLDAGITDEHPYLVMQLVDGPSLAGCIADAGGAGLDPDRVAAMGCQIAEALAYAHQSGVVHRDVKPGNILISADDERVLLTDFGIARLLADAAHHTKTGQTIGSPAYLSPEQVDGSPMTAAVDVYSLGLVLLEALTGVRAYTGSPIEAAVARLSTGPAIPTSLDIGWRTLLAQMTQLDPEERPTALEVAATLGAAVSASSAPQLIPPTDVDTGALDVTGGLPLVEAYPSTGAGSRRLTTTGVLVGVLLVALIAGAVAAALTLFGGKQVAASEAYEAPAGVPAKMVGPLEELHEAVADNPLLTPRLHLVDQALAAHRFADARADLSALAKQTRTARTTGDLDRSEAARILKAIARLTALLPGTRPTPGAQTSGSGSSPRSSPSPSATPDPTTSPTAAKPTPTRAPTGQATPTPTPTPTPTATTDPTTSPVAAPADPSPSG